MNNHTQDVILIKCIHIHTSTLVDDLFTNKTMIIIIMLITLLYNTL